MQEDFLEKANSKRNEYLLETEALFTANIFKWCSDFADHFRSVCAQIRKMQDESSLSAISYLEYTMLYTNFIKRRYVAQVRVYGDKSYLDENQRAVCDYDVSFLFACFDRLWDELLVERKRYIGKVSALDVKSFMMQTLPEFYSYLASVARYVIEECVICKPFVEIETNERFMVNVGDYMAATDSVFRECKNKDAAKLAKWFGKRFGNEYLSGDYSDLDFSGRDFSSTCFGFSRFCCSCLNNASLQGSSLIGVSFYKSCMENCNLDGSAIHEADFSYATLKDASFIEVIGRAGLPDPKKWDSVGFLPVRFRHADLTNADFTGANLAGADFTGSFLADTDFTSTILSGADFTGATLCRTTFADAAMDGAKIDRAIVEELELSPEQLKAIRFI